MGYSQDPACPGEKKVAVATVQVLEEKKVVVVATATVFWSSKIFEILLKSMDTAKYN